MGLNYCIFPQVYRSAKFLRLPLFACIKRSLLILEPQQAILKKSGTKLLQKTGIKCDYWSPSCSTSRANEFGRRIKSVLSGWISQPTPALSSALRSVAILGSCLGSLNRVCSMDAILLDILLN